MTAVHDELTGAWSYWLSAELYLKWKQGSPGESAKIDAYRAGGPLPSTVGWSKTGKALLTESMAWRDTLPPVPPSAKFGASLFEGFEWAQAEIVGTTVKPTNNQELANALKSGAEIIDLGGRSLTPGELKLPVHSSFRMLMNGRLDASRVYHTNIGKWRLRKMQLVGGKPEDNIKGEQGGFLDIDQCLIQNAPRQGLILYPHDDVVLRNSRLQHNGSNVNENHDHGTYYGVGSRSLAFNNAYFDNYAFQEQIYPRYHQHRSVCCTFYGGTDPKSGGVVFGSENQTDATRFVTYIGGIVAKSPRWAFSQWQKATDILLEDCVWWDCKLGGVSSADAVVKRLVHGDPKFANPLLGDFAIGAGSAAIGIIDPSLWRFVPPTDIVGRARLTADAGAWAAS